MRKTVLGFMVTFMGISTSVLGRPIVCSKYDFLVRAGAHPYQYNFTPSDCGGRLPDRRYIGVLSKTEVCGVEASWVVQQPEEGTPGVRFWTIDGCENGQSEIQVVFIELYPHR